MREPSGARWIWTDLGAPAPTNRYTWFRTVVDLQSPPSSGVLAFAADSTAQLWLNGYALRRKVTRFHEPKIRAERVDASARLRRGRNVFLVLHHSWGPIETFQRSAAVHAGLFLASEFVETDENWRWRTAEEFSQRVEQFQGLVGGARRVRFPVDWDASHADPALMHRPDFDDAGWERAVPVLTGPWPRPEFVETSGQRESDQRPLVIVAAGALRQPPSSEQKGTSSLQNASYVPDPRLARSAMALLEGKPLAVTGAAGETGYLTIDFQRPVHGFPFVELSADADIQLRLTYGELATSPSDGRPLVSQTGWVDADSVVAVGYADLIRPFAAHRRRYELPEERTARWLTVHITFRSAGTARLHDLGIVKSQYPIEFRGSFACGEERIDQIVKLGLIHAEVAMTDVFVDTPGREDAQWLEDARPRAQLAARWFGETALRRVLIRTIAESQTVDGLLPPFAPSNYPYGPAQWDWAAQWVGMLYDDYMWHDDRAFVEAYLPHVRRFWEGALAHLGADGVWRSTHVLGDLRTSVPPEAGSSSSIAASALVDRLRDSARLAAAAGQHELATEWDRTADRMADAFRRHHLVRSPVGRGLIVADTVDVARGTHTGYSQAAQAGALLSGLLTDDEAADVIDETFPPPVGAPPAGVRRWNTPTWSSRVLTALTSHGRDRRAVAHLLERYAPYLPGHPRNLTPIALQGPYGGPLPEYWLTADDLGLASGELNDATVPDATGSHGWGAVPLLWLHEGLLGVAIESPGGDVLTVAPRAGGLPFIGGTTHTPRGPVWLHYEPAEPRLTIEIPDCTAHLRLPEEFSGVRVRVHGEAESIDHEAGRAVLVGPGSYTFVAEGPAW